MEQNRKVLIIGGVAGGASAAARLRRLDENARIIMLERGEHISYANCGLPYYIGDKINDEKKLLVQTPQAMAARFNIDVRVNNEVISIDPEKKTVKVKDKVTDRIYEETYDKIILSPGAKPFVPPVEGKDLPGVFTLRTVPDTKRIKEYIEEGRAKSAVVVGGGFIGLELAENLHEKGLAVDILEAQEHIMNLFDTEMAILIENHLIEKGVGLRLGLALNSISKQDGKLVVKLSNGDTIPTDMVLICIGVRAETELAKSAGLKIGEKGGIWVNRHQQTSNPDIYAVGDAAETYDLVTQRDLMLPLAGPANRQGRLAANHICGIEEEFSGVIGTFILKVFDIAAAGTGQNEKWLKLHNTPYEKVFLHPLSHAGYYPGSSQMTLKLLFSTETRKILGAQAVGPEGIDKRIDVIATALKLSATVDQLQNLELCYAPPFSSAKDPVNMAGFAAVNVLDGITKIKHWDEVDSLDRDKFLVLDVRTPAEYELGHIPDAMLIPVDDLRSRYDELPRDKSILIYCKVGIRGYIAERILREKGFEDIYNLSGGYQLYGAAHQCNIPKPGKGNISCLGYTDLTKDGSQDVAAEKQEYKERPKADIDVDAGGLQCPGPILKASEGMKELRENGIMHILATDPSFATDINVWAQKTGNRIVWHERVNSEYHFWLQKGNAPLEKGTGAVSHDKNMVIFSGDLDKAIASFIIANGAAAMGRKVSMFFTFWGLNILRKPKKVKVKKDFISRMFGMMMPRGSLKLGLSKLNMLGMGKKMIRMVMKKKNISSLEELIKTAMDNGVRIIACTMSMDVMGIKREELIDGIEIGGVATMLGSAEESDSTFFI